MVRQHDVRFGFVLCALAAGCGAVNVEPTTPARDAAASDAGVDGSLAPEAGGDAQAAEVGAELSEAIRALALPRDRKPPPDTSNRFADDPAAAAFGQRLFFDGAFSGRLLDGDNDGGEHALGVVGDTGKVACAGCHVPASAFTDSRSLRQQISLAAGWGKRRSPSLLDVAHSPLLMWDGVRDTLHSQIFSVIESAVEMNSSRLYTAQVVFAKHRAEYEAIFGALPPLGDTTRFPTLGADRTGCSQLDQNLRACKGEWHGVPGDHAEYDGMSAADQDAVTRVVVNIGKALGSYQRTLTCGESRFDRWARGDDAGALSASEQRGAALFVGKAKCATCHKGPYFSDEKFHNVGLKPALVATVFVSTDDPGARAGLAALKLDPLNSNGSYSDGYDGRIPDDVSSPALEGAFRTTKLRCISLHPSFMHTGQFGTLDDVVAFFDRGGDEFGFLGHNELEALSLSVQERTDLTAFLRSLEGPGPDASLLQAR